MNKVNGMVALLFFVFLTSAAPEITLKQQSEKGTDITVGYRTRPELYCPSSFYPAKDNRIICHPTLVLMPEEDLKNNLDASWPCLVNLQSAENLENVNSPLMPLPASDVSVEYGNETLSFHFVSLASTDISAAYRTRPFSSPIPDDTTDDYKTTNCPSIPDQRLPPILDALSPILLRRNVNSPLMPLPASNTSVEYDDQMLSFHFVSLASTDISAAYHTRPFSSPLPDDTTDDYKTTNCPSLPDQLLPPILDVSSPILLRWNVNIPLMPLPGNVSVEGDNQTLSFHFVSLASTNISALYGRFSSPLSDDRTDDYNPINCPSVPNRRLPYTLDIIIN